MKSRLSLMDEFRQQMERLKPNPDQIYTLHNNIRRLTNQFDAPGPEMESVEDFNVPHEEFPVAVRLYTPKGGESTPGPVILFLHGGGFVTCSLESHEGIALRMAEASKFRVLSVDYRLAPQFPFPAGPDDCELVLNWVLSGAAEAYGIDGSCVAIAGDSAGGNMSAYLAQSYRTDIKAQVLYYPLMQLVELKPVNPAPQDWLQLGFMALKFIDEHYAKDADRHQTRLSPLFETDLKGLPPAYILTCGLDPLRHEGREYADKLEVTEIEVKYAHEKAMPHGFLNFSRVFPKGKIIARDAGLFVRKHILS